MAGCKEHVEEDYVEYFLFPRLPTVRSNKSVRETLEELVDLYTAHLSSYLIQYIWQKDPFILTVVDTASGNTPPHIYGRTYFSDNIDDEWFIVFLLHELTKGFPDLIVRVIDNDGEFLLIEMADHLPKWMNPETTENRVFIYQGTVHVVPRPTKSGPFSDLPVGTPTVAEAVKAINEYPVLTKCDNMMQRAINRRIGSFPDKIHESHHRAHCYLPAAIANLLKHYPSFLSAAVQAFYNRDLQDLKACKVMKYFPPETRVMTEVIFTKCLYAQLMQQKYVPDKLVGWNLPPLNNPAFKPYDLGMKLACGFEILATNCNYSHYERTKNSAERKDMHHDIRWNRYLHCLKERGYFRNELEGSALYKELHQRAHQYYFEYLKDAGKNNKSQGEQLLALLDTLEYDIEELQREGRNLRPPDDDSWLEISPEQLESLLQEKFQRKDETDNTEQLSNSITNSLHSFVNHQSSYQGAEFPKKREKPNREKANRITFDPEAFGDAMTSILDFKVPEWEEGSSSDMSDYSDEYENDMDFSKLKLKETTAKKSKDASELMNTMQRYMEQMDRELATTAVGQSFERTQSDPTKINESNNANPEGEDDFEYQPVDTDLTALRNILESYSSQQGLPGPASNLFGSMGIQLPNNSDA